MVLTLCLGCSHMEDIRATVEMRTLHEVCSSALSLATFGFFPSSLMDSGPSSSLVLSLFKISFIAGFF